MRKLIFIITILSFILSSCNKKYEALAPHPVKKIEHLSKRTTTDTSLKCNVMEKYQLTPPYQILKKSILGKSYFQQLYPTDSLNKLIKITSKAFFLGVYTTDLIYTLLYYNQPYFQQYYQTVVNLATDLGLKETFVKEKIQKLSDSLIISKKTIDSIRLLVESSIIETCQFLDQNSQVSILPFTLVGSWSEAMYLIIGNTLHNQNPSAQLYQIISQQPQTIQNLKNYINDAMLDLESFEISQALINLKNQLDSLNQVYTELLITDEAPITKQALSKLYSAFNQIKKSQL